MLIPHGFSSGIEAHVRNDDQFVCRADILSHVRRRTERDGVVLTFGSDQPALRVVSLEASVVIDNMP